MSSLLEKLSSITEELGALSKGGSNSKFNYKYVKGEDAMMEFRTLEVKHKIKVLPVMRDGSLTITQKESGLITTFVVDYNICDLESKESLRVSIPVQGYDSTDKGVYKALTGGFKYFLLQTFSYSSDDPEKETAEEKKESSTTETSTTRFKTGPKVAFKPTVKVEETSGAVDLTVVATTPTGGTPTTVVAPTPTGIVNTPKLPANGSAGGATFRKPNFAAIIKNKETA